MEAFWFIRDVDAPASTRAEAPADIAAAQLIGQLHDALAPSISGHDLEGFLTRIVFYLFADDTGIFDARHLLWDYLETRTADDGHDLGGKLAHLFQVLDTDAPDRSANLDADLAAFPYVNGALFDAPILGARAAHPGATLADLYDPDLMPPDLRRAHTALDRAVDRLYHPRGFQNDRERVEHLFQRYEAMVKPLLAPKPRRKPRRKADAGI